MKGLLLIRLPIELCCPHILLGVKEIKTCVILLPQIGVVNHLLICQYKVLALTRISGRYCCTYDVISEEAISFCTSHLCFLLLNLSTPPTIRANLNFDVLLQQWKHVMSNIFPLVWKVCSHAIIGVRHTKCLLQLMRKQGVGFYYLATIQRH